MSDPLQAQRAGLRAWIRGLGHGSPGAALFERDGVTASIVPACPERSIVNSALYETAARLEAALPDLAAAYADAGIRAWTVWVPAGDEAAADVLAFSEHALDGEPAAMSLELSELQEPSTDELEVDRSPSLADFSRINDLAYGFEEGHGPGPAMAFPAGEDSRCYAAVIEGRPVCVAQTIDVGDVCGVFSVATLKGYRGRGLASALIGAALTEARERGLRASTLQASMLGKGVYERLGYGVDFRWQLWERRAGEGKG